MRLPSELYWEILSIVDLLPNTPFYKNAQLVQVIDDQILRLRMWASHVEDDSAETFRVLDDGSTAANLVNIARFNLERILELFRWIAESQADYTDAIDQLEERIESLDLIKHGIEDVQRTSHIEHLHYQLSRIQDSVSSGALHTPSDSKQQSTLILPEQSLPVVMSGQNIPQRLLPSLSHLDIANQDWSRLMTEDLTIAIPAWNKAESILSESNTQYHQSSISARSTATSVSSYDQGSDDEDKVQDATPLASNFPSVGAYTLQRTSRVPPVPEPMSLKYDVATPEPSRFERLEHSEEHENLEDAIVEHTCDWYLRWNFDDVAFNLDRFTLPEEDMKVTRN